MQEIEIINYSKCSNKYVYEILTWLMSNGFDVKYDYSKDCIIATKQIEIIGTIHDKEEN